MNELEKWTEITKGIYRYVISAGACYEIHIQKWYHGTDILTARSNLYIVGDWRTSKGENFFERELITEGQSVESCMMAAKKDFDENNVMA